ncbi:hypothetical protein CJ030_MR3G009397 [Morella rubra]|uniref:NmrA-like domain-containing protein n=1 Tax=Morella rubra TaxID=262757 RepID=A0A6A1W6X1_9ROSI|nr:hypothetical protein CJ030_MR3G009397 [Morella rubra]
MVAKSRILIIGGTSYIEKCIVEASAKAGHPTFALVRKSTLSDPVKGKLFKNFENLGVAFLHRFLPSEFRNDLDRVHGVGPAKTLFTTKAQIRRKVEAEGIPFTYVASNLTPKNFYSYNELVALWEKKIGKTLEKTYISENKILKDIQECPVELMSMKLSIIYSIFVKGDQTNFETESSLGVEATELYPDVKYTTVEEYLDQFFS